ncbi:hypothetical protein [Candidatus Spongiihabitans sp.]|uniref:hypothetical protein n=1 Tax=Candidatus Spongiihabitans sp. TaxID=3101308 RepID=UPI003C7B6D67
MAVKTCAHLLKSSARYCIDLEPFLLLSHFMSSHEHKKLIECIKKLDATPKKSEEFSEWITACKHLEFLRQNSYEDEVVIFASGEYSFIHTMVVSNSLLRPIDQDDLLRWSCSPYTSTAGYVWGGGRDDVRVERESHLMGANTLENATNLVFGRTFEGWKDHDRTYFELHSEYSHITEIHWRPEHRAYVRFDHHGDLEHIVSVTQRQDESAPDVTLVSFKWKPLEEYLAATDSSLVRMFDFTLLRRSSFSGWPNGDEDIIKENDHFFYRQKIASGHAAYTCGAQIIPLRRPKEDIFSEIKEGRFSDHRKQYAVFIICDWRNKKITKVSTNPRETTNYFEARNNTLPFELSPAFFRPEVISKYKQDRDKYTITERSIRCRAAWTLNGFDINDAGQVHAYICDLRNLPYSEQQYWASFNEKPQSGISKRALINDFKGEFTDFTNPLQQVLQFVRRWNEKNVSWWTLREDTLFEQINIPVTSSRDEWSGAFMDLSKLIIEGFEVTTIRAKLDEAHLLYDKNDRSIALLEKLTDKGRSKEEQRQLMGLRTIQRIRSKVKGHSGGSEAKELEKNALLEHETFRKHFMYVCGLVIDELEVIEDLFS